MVLVTIDTLRADHVTERLTPGLARLAREAVVLDQAISVGSVTLPAHASLLTGLYPPAHGVRDNTIYALPPQTPTYTAALRRAGYATAAFVSALVLDSRYGLDAGFDTYDDEIGDAPERRAADTIARAQAWLAAHDPSAPFFVWVHLFEPHAPYLEGSYAGDVGVADRALDGFFAWLRERGLWDDLVLSVTSDHGESLGEHGEKTHGFFVYDATLRIPWLLKAPAARPGRFPHQVRLVDVLPTMIAYAGAGLPALDGDGIDLRRFVERGESPRLDAYAETFLPLDQFRWSELRAWRTEALKYIAAPRPELYDLRADPGERRSIVSERSGDAERAHRIIERIERGGRLARAEGVDAGLQERMRALGYIGFAEGRQGTTPGALPDPKDKLEVYTLVMTALELSESGRPDDALDALARAQRLDPDVTQIHYVRGSILGTQGRYGEAAAALERAVALNPAFTLARFKLALALVRLARFDRAEAVLRDVLRDEPRNVRAYHNLAAIAYSRGDLAAAERLERQALAIDPEYFEAWNTLGAIFVTAKRHGEAIDALTHAVRLNPRSGQAHYNLSLALRAGGRPDAARAAEARGCELDRRYCTTEQP